MSRLYLMRHGQAGPRFNYDALSDLGRTQSRLLGEYLAGQKLVFAAIYSGALSRQQETACQVREVYWRAGLAAPEVVVDPRWNEFDLGGVYQDLAPVLSAEDPEFERDYKEMTRAMPDQGAAVHRSTTRCDVAVIRAWVEGRHPHAGESWPAFRERVTECLQTLAEYRSGETVAVFTSATPIAVWVGLALGLADGKLLRLAGVSYNSGITTLRMHQRELTLFGFNSIPHLPDPCWRSFR